MVCVTPRQLAAATGARLVSGPDDRVAEGVAIDSRSVGQGNLFVAFAGERVDGNDYAQDALAAGASVLVLTREPVPGLLTAAEAAGAAVLVADDATAFLQDLASWWRDGLDCVVVGVTGSSGKTTTKEMTAAVLASTYRTHATAGNLNSLIGAPLTVLSCPRDAQALVVEMGMNELGEIAAIARVARPHLGVITNVGVAHIGILGSRQNIARAKAELAEALPPSDEKDDWPSRLLLWGEDDFTGWIAESVARPRGVRTLTFGTAPGDDARCPAFELGPDGCACGEAALPSGARFELSLAIPGAHNVVDAMAAAAVGDLLGVEPASIARALAGVRPVGMHQNLVQAPGGFTVLDDSYNANADSMRRAVDVLCALEGARRIACLGDMGELGADAEVLHAAIGAYVAAKPVDLLVTVGPLSHAMADAARLMGMGDDRVIELQTAQEAARVLGEVLQPGDALLVKASRSTGLDAVAKEVIGR